MIVECPYCHMTLLDQFNGQFRCWWCHIWLRKDQIVILGEYKGLIGENSASVDLHRTEEAVEKEEIVRHPIG